MNPTDIKKLRALTDFSALVDYLRDELDWPIEVEDADEITFEYDPKELGIDPKHAVKIETIKQVRPLVDGQPWGIFYIEFEAKRLPVVVLRRILRTLAPTGRQRAPDRPAWRMSDLLFISAQGQARQRRISFAHFRQREGRVAELRTFRAELRTSRAELRTSRAELRTFSWDVSESHFYYIQNLNLAALRWPADEADADAWREQWRQAFTVEHRYTIRKSQELAREMARQARAVRELVAEVYDLEADDGPLHKLHDSFKEVLLHDLTPRAFADMTAQTVAYGLFSAAAQTDDGPSRGLGYERLVELIPNTNPFLRDLLAELAAGGAIDIEELGVGQLVDLLRATDMDAILRDFGRQTGAGREDPVIHFYEDFLREYDREQRVRRGVFYTPDPVVSYIVRSVDHLLRTEFDLADGLADTSADPESGEPLVQILDPATGTGTFLAHVIDQIESRVKAQVGADWNAYVAEHLLPRLNGFELMMAPYAVAHMKLGLKLRQTGYDFSGDERLRVYLTNTLEEPVEMHEHLALVGFLSKEANEAARVKRRTPITVVIGNPPYAGHSANDSEWIAGLLRGRDGEGRRVESYFEVDGQPLGERNPKWLNDDYVKFIRLGQWRVEQTGAGILAFITNHGYLDNPTFRGMRQSLLAAFDALYVLDLHGSSKKKETTPQGDPDENVFEIMPGVAILLAVKRPAQTSEVSETSEVYPQVYHADLWGLRGQKYAYLRQHDVSRTAWQPLAPAPPFYLLVPQDVARRTEYQQGWKITETMPTNVLGFQTHRDRFAIAFDEAEIQERLTLMRGKRLSDEEFREQFRVRDNPGWRLARAREQLRADPDWQKAIIRCDYRPFDNRWCYFSPVVMDRPRRELLDHVAWRENLCLLSSRQQATLGYRHCLVTRKPANDCVVSTTSREANQVFPLYLYPDARNATLFDRQEPTDAPGGRRPNLAPEFLADLSESLGLRFIPDGRGDLQATFGPEDVFHYAYAVLHSPTYRSRYAEFLKIDFPRLPLTSDRALFVHLVGLGADLVALHLLEDDYAAASWNRPPSVPPKGREAKPSPLQRPLTSFVERDTGSTMGAFSKRTCYENGRVYLDTSQRSRSSYFEGVPEAVWNFHIGGYQVGRKWLYDRRGVRGQPGRTLTEEEIEHYRRIVAALQETMRLMDEIDAVIDRHGGWPIE